jgi:hypothetical protein
MHIGYIHDGLIQPPQGVASRSQLLWGLLFGVAVVLFFFAGTVF